MLKRLSITLAFCAACALLSVACGGSSNSNHAAATNAADSSAGKAAPGTAPDSTDPASTAGVGERISVPECEEYVAKYEACVSKGFDKLPPAMRAKSENTLAFMRKSWRDRAADPQQRVGLGQACKQAMDAARESMKSMNCEF
jgi:hypothetical protein